MAEKTFFCWFQDITDVIITHSHHDHIEAIGYYEKCLTDKICTGSSYNEKESEKFIAEFSQNKYIPLLFHDSKILQGRLGYSIIKN